VLEVGPVRVESFSTPAGKDEFTTAFRYYARVSTDGLGAVPVDFKCED
jgi:hypothetical protein